MATVKPLDPSELFRRCDPEQFRFETTADLTDLEEVIGQERAVAAIEFSIGIEQEGYNLFALGPYGSGKYTAVSRSLEKRAAKEPVPDDWCYVNDFEERNKPNALRLPAGQGQKLSRDMERLVEELFATIPAAFEGEEYHAQRQSIEAEFRERQESALEEIQKKAEAEGIALIRTQAGLAFAPVREKEVISPEEFMKLPEEERQQIESKIQGLQEELQRIIRQVPQWSREGRSKTKELNEEVAILVVAPLIEEMKSRYQELPEVVAYLEAVQKDIIEHTELFADSDEGQASPLAAAMGLPQRQPREALGQRYQVNVIVDNSESQGAPIIYEQNPIYQNLIGRVEHVAQMGALLTDFTLIKPGALHRANGGYLIVDARKLLLQPFAWEGLKRALRAGEICIESPGQGYSLISTVSLEPEPIPLNVKVILLGERLLYYLLYQHDPEFSELFKVAADFEDEMDRNDENNLAYTRLIATIIRKDDLRPFDRQAVAQVIERSARHMGDKDKLSVHMQSIADLVREADYWAGMAGASLVGGEHVQRAVEARIYRASRIEERIQEAILREIVFIDTTGEKVGQVNGLSVFIVGDYAFGRPSRITARVRLGKGEVIDIERQVELGGPLHSKGVLILSSYLGARYAVDRPLSLAASLVFEQSYGGVEGDSASSAELYALLSALAEAPVKQSLAVTGSVNQHGQVQTIGGVNEKIEGFFEICQARGLTGEQGVVIPKANVKHLMLRQDVREAAAAGQFHIYPVETIDQGIELLTGLPAGEPDAGGKYPEGTINQRIIARLEKLAEKQRQFNRPAREERETQEEDKKSKKGKEDEPDGGPPVLDKGR
ncbi:MAG: AAA family ATPase [Chloroflexi bacterium]|nr:AAA family ATPase [Chloroflexota bacterium]MCI0577564.1 AAA family ATPase [Chloroflexota bacterium]MCI0646226.1 AAA family ATPase [Chloroflexota bacterium]MCI0732079.1 AAA family ATPase [Chloroflexota bacterium]